MSVRILVGDVRAMLATLPDESVHTVVTSPPYWGLRDYGVVGQIGLEASPAEFVATMVEVFREVRRVLRADGTCWVNLGDSYAGSGRGGNTGHGTSTTAGGQPDHSRAARSAQEVSAAQRENCPTVRGSRLPAGLHASAVDAGAAGRAWTPPPSGLKQKDLVGIPWRVAFALQADGWYLRQDIIWAKPNPMPESVRDRCTKSHEYIFLLAKSERYYYDFDAMQEKASENTNPRRSIKMPDGWDTGAGGHGSFHREGREKGKTRKLAEPGSGTKNNSSFDAAMAVMPETRNKRSVWTVATAPVSEAHFATFPPALIEPCILAGCPVGGTVLDPFGGAGTTGLVADRHGRDAILIELNPDYAEMARRRIAGDSPLFAEVT